MDIDFLEATQAFFNEKDLNQEGGEVSAEEDGETDQAMATKDVLAKRNAKRILLICGMNTDAINELFKVLEEQTKGALWQEYDALSYLVQIVSRNSTKKYLDHDLLIKIIKKTDGRSRGVFTSLAELATVERMRNIVTLDLLKTIVEKAGVQARWVFDTLKSMVMMRVVREDNIEDAEVLIAKLLEISESESIKKECSALEQLSIHQTRIFSYDLDIDLFVFLLKCIDGDLKGTLATAKRFYREISNIQFKNNITGEIIKEHALNLNMIKAIASSAKNYFGKTLVAYLKFLEAHSLSMNDEYLYIFTQILEALSNAGLEEEIPTLVDQLAENEIGLTPDKEWFPLNAAQKLFDKHQAEAKGEEDPADQAMAAEKQREVPSVKRLEIKETSISDILHTTYEEDQAMAAGDADYNVGANDLRLFYINDPEKLAKLKEALKSKSFVQVLDEITEENYKEGEYLAALFLRLRIDVSSAASLSFNEFYEIVVKGKVTELSSMVEAYVIEQVFGVKVGLSKSEQKMVISLSYELHDFVMDALDDTGRNTVTFREIRRFNVDFSKYYLQQEGFAGILELFVLTASNVYGRVLDNKEKVDKLGDKLVKLFHAKQFEGLFKRAEAESGWTGNEEEKVRQLINYADYHDVEREPSEDEVPIDVHIKALINRSVQIGSDLLLMVDNDNGVFTEKAIEKYGEDDDVEMLRLSMSNFSKRQELLGMYLPKEKAEATEKEVMAWLAGVLVKTAKAARDNEDKKFIIVMDNISAAPDSVRLLLNPILWERMIEIPEQGINLSIPDNMNFVMTMHRETEIKDDSFLNRPILQYVNEVNDIDIKKHLLLDVGLDEDVVHKLITVYEKLKERTWTDHTYFTFSDILEIALRIKGAAQEQGYDQDALFKKEAYNYLYMRLRTKKEKDDLDSLFDTDEEKVEKPKIIVDRERGVVNFDGVELSVSKEFLKKAHGNEHDFVKLMSDTYEYDVVDMETRLLCQLARQYKYGGLTVQLEGPSGEGKTEAGRVFTYLVDLSLREFTVNEDTGTEELRGQLRPTKNNTYELYEPKYLDQIVKGGNAFLFNEINTSEASALYYWLYPEIAARNRKVLSEFATSSKDDIAKTIKISQNNLWIFTVNPDSFKGRNITPPRVISHTPRFYVATEIEDIPKRIERAFKTKGLKNKKMMKFANMLSDIHVRIREAKKDGVISSPQDITPREYLDIRNKFISYMGEGLPENKAFEKAVEEVYAYMWKGMNDIKFVAGILKKVLGKDFKISTADQILELAIERSKRPVMVLHNSANYIPELEEKIRRIDPEGTIIHTPRGYFDGKRQFIGGLMPPREEDAQAGAVLQEDLGVLPELIRRARFSKGEANIYGIMTNYTHLSSRAAPILNEFFQTGRIEGIIDKMSVSLAEKLIEQIKEEGQWLWEKLKEEYGEDLPQDINELDEDEMTAFAVWFYGQAPENLKIIATGSSEDEINLSIAEINRFLTVNISEEFTKEWVKKHLEENMPQKLQEHKRSIIELVGEVFKYYEEQRVTREYKHNRMSRDDIEALFTELTSYKTLSKKRIKKIVYYVLGIGLRTAFRNDLTFVDEIKDVENAVRYEEREDGIYIIADMIEYRTDLESIPDIRFLAPTETLVRQVAALLIALKTDRVSILEGHPGGGKTSGITDLAKRLGLKFSNDVMYEDIDMGVFIGNLSVEGSKQILTSLKMDSNGEHVVKFLRAYKYGGIHLLDEGAVGANSREVIALLAELAQLDEFDLGNFFPGLQGHIIKRHEDFRLVIAQNPASITKSREPLSYRVDTMSHKIWVDNALGFNDAIRIINYYLEEGDCISDDMKKIIANIHIKFSEEHEYKEELSPRQLIRITEIINKAVKSGGDIEWAIFEGLVAAYLTRLSRGEFIDAWKVISKETGGIMDVFLERWEMPIEVDSESYDKFIQFNGTMVPRSSGKSNVDPEDIILVENLASQSRILREIALGVSLKMPVALLNEEGADDLDIVRKFAKEVGYELYDYWSHEEDTKMHLLSSVLPQFSEELDRYGIKRDDVSDEFVMRLGFIARHLVRKDKYDKREDNGELLKHKILFFNMMDSIPERQRVMLNELLTTGKIELIDTNGQRIEHVLPEEVHIVASSTLDHKYSSAFINRFMPIRVNAITSTKELSYIIRNRYPLVKKREVSWLKTICGHVHGYDQHKTFAKSYGFSPKDVFKLAETVQILKQKDIANDNFRTNPLYYVMKAAYLIYNLALSEDEDLPRYEEDIIIDRFLVERLKAKEPGIARALYKKGKKEIEDDLHEIEKEDHIIRVNVSKMAEGELRLLENGISIERAKDGYVIKTEGANIYQAKDEKITDWFELAEDERGEFYVKKEGQQLLLKLSLIKSIGGFDIHRSEYNYNNSLPENEVPTKEFIRHTMDLRRLEAGLFNAWQRVEDNMRKVRRPRVALINGLTGTAKTTLIRNIRRIRGVPLYILNSHEELKSSDFTIGMKLQDGNFEVGIKEFLARVGKINGKRISIPSSATSNRKILLIDEANASPQLLTKLAPLFRGEKKFHLEYAGESVEVEVDEEVMIVLTFNPAETYSGRYEFPREIAAFADKFWAPNPMNYDRETIIDILYEYHRRGITKKTKEIEQESARAQRIAREGHFEVDPYTEEVKRYKHPKTDALEKVWEGIEADEGDEGVEESDGVESGAMPPVPKPKKHPIKVTYSRDRLIREAKNFGKSHGYLKFTEEVLTYYILALAHGNKDKKLRDLVLKAAKKLDNDVVDIVNDAYEFFNQKSASKSEFKKWIFKARRFFVEKGVYLFILLAEKEAQSLVYYPKLIPEEVLGTIELSDAQIKFLGEDPKLYKGRRMKAVKVEGDKYLKALGRSNIAGYFEGEMAVVFAGRTDGAFGVPSEDSIDWTGMHELGHVMDNARLKARGIIFPKKVKWTKLAKLARHKGLWVSDNLELNSMLFPTILSKYAKEYALKILIDEVTGGDEKDYYVQASKGILNGIMMYLKKTDEAGLKTMGLFLEDDFNQGVINAIAGVIEKEITSSKQLNEIAAELFKEGEKYLSSAKKGAYKGKGGGSGGGGDTASEFLEGVDGMADVESEQVDGEMSSDGSEIEVETNDPDGDQTQIYDDEPRPEGGGPGEPGEGEEGEGGEPGGGDPGEGGEDYTPPETGMAHDVMKLMDIAPNLVSEFLEVFAGEAKYLKQYSETGDEIVIERIILRELEPFVRKKLIQSLASVSMGITMDVSGSIKWSGLWEPFLEATKLYTSLLHLASVANKDVAFSLSAISDRYDTLLEFMDCKDKKKVQNALEALPSVGTGGGINTVAVLNGIREKYKTEDKKIHRMEVILNDGGETSRVPFEDLRRRAEELEKELNIDIIFVGFGKEGKDVTNYGKYIHLMGDITQQQLMKMIINLSLLKVERGELPTVAENPEFWEGLKKRIFVGEKDVVQEEGDEAMIAAAFRFFWNYKVAKKASKALKDAGIGDGKKIFYLIWALARNEKENLFMAYMELINLAIGYLQGKYSSSAGKFISNIDLLTVIAESSGGDVYDAYYQFHDLAETIKDNGLNKDIPASSLWIDKLIDLMTYEDNITGHEYLTILRIVNGSVDEENIDQIETLIKTINGIAGDYAYDIYGILGELINISSKLSGSVFDPEFLLLLTKRFEGDDFKTALVGIQILHKTVDAIEVSNALKLSLTNEKLLKRMLDISGDSFSYTIGYYTKLIEKHHKELTGEYINKLNMTIETLGNAGLGYKVPEFVSVLVDRDRLMDTLDVLNEVYGDELTSILEAGALEDTDEAMMVDIAEIRRNTKQALTDAGIDETNSEDLLSAVQEAASAYVKDAYNALNALAEKGAVNEKNLDQVRDLLESIAREAGLYGMYAWKAYNTLIILTEEGVVNEENIDQIKNLMVSIAKKLEQRS